MQKQVARDRRSSLHGYDHLEARLRRHPVVGHPAPELAVWVQIATLALIG
jgi:hypothetical protein